MNDSIPRLTFFTELPAERFPALIDTPGVVETLCRFDFGVSVGLLDLSDARARTVRQLNEAGVRVHAWLLLPKEQGYWFNAANVAESIARYHAFRTWARRHDLRFERVGLDIEPPLQQAEAAMRWGRPGLLWWMLCNLARSRHMVTVAARAYNSLVTQIRSDGWSVEVYHLPFVADARRARSSVLNRMFQLVDLKGERDVFMLYSSPLLNMLGSDLGGAFVEAYGSEADGIGVGITGGGVELEFSETGTWQPLTPENLARDLRLARRHTDEIYIFSLEGCVWDQPGLLAQIVELDWSLTATADPQALARVRWFRRGLWTFLWLAERPAFLLGLALGIWATRRWWKVK